MPPGKKTITSTVIEDRFYVDTPYSKDFITKAKEIGGKWDPERKMWYFPLSQSNAAKALCVAVFAMKPREGQVATAKVAETTKEGGKPGLEEVWSLINLLSVEDKVRLRGMFFAAYNDSIEKLIELEATDMEVY